MRATSRKRERPRNSGSVAVPQPYWFTRHPWLHEAGILITPETALDVSAVYACCRLIVDSIAPAPIKVVEVKRGGVRETLHDDPVAYTLEWGASPVKNPDAPTGQAVEEALLWSALLDGNGYAEIQVDAANRFVALWPIESTRVLPWRDADGTFYYRVSRPGSIIAGGEAGTLIVPPHRMFHLRGPSLYGWTGDSPVYRAAKAIGIAGASQVYASAYFANGTAIGGLLSSEKLVTKDQADRAREQWEESHKGPAAAHKIAVTGQGLKYQPIGHNAQEAQLVESRRFQVQEIARFFGVPTTLLADNEAWTNLSELYLGFYRNALLPWAARFDAEATRKLFPERQSWREVQHDLTQLTMGSFKERVEALKSAVNSGLKTRNEARVLLGDNGIGPDGDVLMVETTVKALSQSMAELKNAELKALPEVFAYHLEQGIPTKNEVRARLGLPPVDGGDEFTEPVQMRIDENQAEIQQGDAGSPGAEPEKPEGAEPAPVKTRPRPPESIAREAVTAMFADAFDRHVRRLSNLRAGTQRELSDREREKYRARLVDECASAVRVCTRAAGAYAGTVDLVTFADALDAGEPPDKAAERVVSLLWRSA